MNYKEPQRQSNGMGTGAQVASGAPQEDGVRIDGFQQVLQMLKSADREFRESLLKRLNMRDPKLVQALRADLRKYGL